MEHQGDEVTPPQFGLVDLVDAFTAFRHEYRTQIKETRTIQELMSELFEKLEQLASAPASVGRETESSDASSRYVSTLIEFDIQWTRAIEAVERVEEQYRSARWAPYHSFDALVKELTPWQRWFSQRLIDAFRKSRPTNESHSNSTASEGLTILLARLRQVLTEFQIERIDTLGKPFDGEIMRSIGTVPVSNGSVPVANEHSSASDIPSGHVAQQISPAYLSQGRVLRFADVRVAVLSS